MGLVVNVVVLPFAMLVMGQVDIVGDAVLVEELVKILIINTESHKTFENSQWFYKQSNGVNA